MAVQAVGTLIQRRNISCDHLFSSAAEGCLRKDECGPKLNNDLQRLWRGAETLQNSWDRGTSEVLTKISVRIGDFTGGIGFLNNREGGWDWAFSSWFNPRG